VVIAPFKKAKEEVEIARTAYFAEPPADRLIVDDAHQVIYFRGDSLFQTKFGLSAQRAKEVLAAIDFDQQVLTIVHFDMTGGQQRYVNSMWGSSREAAFDGDVTNVYNHSGSPWGRFFELESSSPAAFLTPGQSLAHHHRTLQFHGPIESLSRISEKVLGVSLEHVRRQMP
jgi:hypothetical protein